MFRIDLCTVAYSNPWDIPLEDRLRALTRGKQRIAYFYETANNSTFRYRAYNMAQTLNEVAPNDISASFFFLADLHRIDDIVGYADILVVCRTGYSHHINQLITRFRTKGKRVLFDIDDLVFDTRYAHLIISTLDQDLEKPKVWDYWFSYLARMGETLRLCDGAITTNNFLAQKIIEFSGKETHVVPNFINREQLEISEKIYQRKVESNFARDERICIGYFSGSPSHNLDYDLITSALVEVLDSDPRVEVMIAGYIEAGPELAKFSNRIQYQQFRDYVNLQLLLGSVEFNLMPLQLNDFTQCKSELKYFEAAIVGTLSIASPAHTYANAIQDEVNGYISQAHQWSSTIRRAIDNLAEYQQLATNAHNDARLRYAGFNQHETILKALKII